MGKYIKKLILTISLIVPLTMNAETNAELKEPSKKLGMLSMVLIGEGLVLANAWLASENPHIYGGALAILSPLGAAEGNASTTTKWVGFLSAESIAVYNLNIDENKKSKSDIFKDNFIAWHLFAATIGISGYLMGDFKSKESLSLRPDFNGGATLVYNRRF